MSGRMPHKSQVAYFYSKMELLSASDKRKQNFNTRHNVLGGLCNFTACQ